MPADVPQSGVAAEELRSFVDRIVRLHEERAGIVGDIADVYAELAGRGFDKAAVRQIVKLMGQDPDERREKDAILDLYCQALGLER